MKFKLALTTATALGLLMGSAMGGENNSVYITQSGDLNRADIKQTGNDNEAGSVTLRLMQSREGTNGALGRYNTLTIRQSGNNNKIGLGANTNPHTTVGGIFQRVRYNSTVENPGLWYNAKNEININQSSNENSVDAVSQLNNTHQGTNNLEIIQRGAGGHIVGSVLQQRENSVSNYATIIQGGSYNTLKSVQQRTGGLVSNEHNVIRVEYTNSSSYNGSRDFSSNVGAGASGAISSTLIQGGSGGALGWTHGNSIDILVSGADNEFGVSQVPNNSSAYKNVVGKVHISGNYNQLGVYQAGDLNSLTLSTIAGNSNNVGLRQVGISNSATINIAGNNNGGDRSFTAQFTGGVALSHNLTPGLLLQEGNGNIADMRVNGDNNVFASVQLGNDNTLNAKQNGSWNQMASVQQGSSNQATVTQNGSDNSSHSLQIGNSNVASITQ